MADQPNVFGNESAPDQDITSPAPNTNSNLGDLLKNIKNENGEQKYKSLEDALVALDHSQKYIPELKNQLTGTQAQLEEMKAQMAKFNNIEESVQRLLAQQQTQRETPPEVTGLDEQAVMKLVQDSLKQSEQVKLLMSNQQKVNDALVGKYGEKAIEVLDAKAAELHTTRQALGELSKQNPDLVLALFSTPANKEPNPAVNGRRTPNPQPVVEELEKPTKSLLSGVSAREQADRLVKIRQAVYNKYDVQN
jgi:hypothetical protein